MTDGKMNNGKVGIEENCGLDMSSSQDLPPNGISLTNNNGKDDSDGSSVFVSGNDNDDPVVNGKSQSFPAEVEEEEKDDAVEQEGVQGHHRENGAADALQSGACDLTVDPVNVVEDGDRAELDSTEVLHVSQEFQVNGVSQDVDQRKVEGEKDCVQVELMMEQLHDASGEIDRGDGDCSASEEIDRREGDGSDPAFKTYESSVESFDVVESDPVQILVDKGKFGVGCPSTNIEGTQDSQVSVIKDAQHNIHVDDVKQLAESKDEASDEKSPQTGSVREFEHNLDMAACTVAEKAEAPDAIDAHASGDHEEGLVSGCALDGAPEASLINDLSLENETLTSTNTAESFNTTGNLENDTLSQENQTLTSANTAESSNITGNPENDTSLTLGCPPQEVANGHITCVKEDSSNSQGSASVSDSVDLHKAMPRESKPLIIAETHPPLLNYENAPLESQESSAARSRDEEPVVDFSDSHPEGNTREHVDTREVTDNFHLVEDTTVQIGVGAETVDVVNGAESLKTMDVDAVNEAETMDVDAVNEADTIDVVNEMAKGCPATETEIEIGTIALMLNSQSPKDVVEGCLHDLANSSSDKDGLVSETEVFGERNSNCIENDADIHCGVDQNATVKGHAKTCEEVENTDGIHMDEISTPSLEGSTADTFDSQNVLTDVATRPFYYMIKIPRYLDNLIHDQIADAEFQVAEKTKNRDAIQAEKQVIRAKCTEYIDTIKAARAARGLLSAKRREIDSINFVIDTVKVASQVSDIDGRICKMEHRMQHETLPLKEEKQLIREIRQLKQDREQLASKMASQAEVQQAIDQKDQAEERLKLLKKEADLLRENFIKAEAAAKVAEQKYDDEQKKLKELDAHFENANAIRQEAYAHLQSLRKQLYEKRRYFSQYRGDLERAKALALNGDREGLQRHCVSQVERVMELWNNDCQYRKDYMRCNLRSTIWRLGTLDGRSLGPVEETPLIPNVIEKVARVSMVPSNPAAKGEKSVAHVDTESNNGKSLTNVGGKKNHTAKAKSPAKPSLDNGSITVFGGDKIEQAREVEHKLTKEEEEIAMKAEELRKAEEAAMLKEQRRMEERVKAKEAMERKKRNADRAQVRAAVRTQKEAEQKEKEREKRERRKEKRKAGTDDMNPAMGDSAPSTEVLMESRESEAREKPIAVAKRPQKVQQFTKQSKAKSMPPPLRNRGKRKMQTLMWALVTVAVVFALFLLGNSSFWLKSWPERFRF